jgi:hypothetical protein
MPLSSHPHVLDMPNLISSMFGECTTYEVPRYAVFSGVLLRRLPQVKRHHVLNLRSTLNVRKHVSHPYRKRNAGALVRQRTLPTERPPLVGEVSANFSG